MICFIILLVALLDSRPVSRNKNQPHLKFQPTPPPIPPNAKFFIDVTRNVGPWRHYWEECVGSGHASTSLRADWQQQMAQVHADLGFKQVRFHGLFIDDMSVVLPAPYSDDPNAVIYSWFNIDRSFDYILSLGMRPYVEIGFTPKLLASGNKTWSHFLANVSPPKDWNQWVDFISSFIRHLVDRYGLKEILKWNFEVWNEPNCCPDAFYTGSMKDYFTLYNATVIAVKSVDSRIRVGGPVTAMSAWIPEFIKFCADNGVPYDFVVTHEYPTDPPGPETREFFSNVLKKTRAMVDPGVPLYYSEYDDAYNDDTSYAAAFIVYQIFSCQGAVDLLSWWPFSDLFEEQGLYPDPFSESGSLFVAGLVNVYGIPKPSYRAFELLRKSGDFLVHTSPDFNYYPTVGTFAVGDSATNGTSIFIVNWDVHRNPNKTVSTQLVISGVDPKSVKISLYRVDSVHGNAMPMWKMMGKPKYLTPKQVEQLTLASKLVREEVNFTILGSNNISLSVDVEGNSIANIVLS